MQNQDNEKESGFMLDIGTLKFDNRGLIPAVVTDVETGDVLMLAYMNAESLRISIDEGRTCFWSRSRGELWRKGENSGNVQHIVSIKADCDRDSLTIAVKKDGPACHTGAESCFFEDVYYSGSEKNSGDSARKDKANAASTAAAPFSLRGLFNLIKDRKINKKAGSYTTYLFEKGTDKILKKIGEESTEVIIAGKAGDNSETVYEIADLTYHIMVLMAELGISMDDVMNELSSRHVIDDKVKQEKMT